VVSKGCSGLSHCAGSTRRIPLERLRAQPGPGWFSPTDQRPRLTAKAAGRVAVRTAGPADGAAVTVLRGRLSAELSVRYPELAGPGSLDVPPDAVCVLARDGVAPVGLVVLDRWRPSPDEGEIRNMYVMPSRRGSGIARLLLTAVEQEARLRGISRLVLETGDRQPEAIWLCETSGFERCHEPGLPNYPWSRHYAKGLGDLLGRGLVAAER
jgi:GNAT superfamily N-acetyltransferase